jgi:hypothetical protein
MLQCVRKGVLLVTASSFVALLAACGSTKTGSASPATKTGSASLPATSATTSAAQRPASPEALARALISPPDLSNLGTLVATDQRSGTGLGVTGSGLYPDITFVSGDPACKDVLAVHPATSRAWASVWMGDKPKGEDSMVNVDEDIESFARLPEAQQDMQQNRDQLANCHSFVGDNNSGSHTRFQFTHQAIPLDPMGDDSIGHQLNGLAEDQEFLVWNEVEIRSGTTMIFLSYSPSERGVANTALLATAAMNKYLSTW